MAIDATVAGLSANSYLDVAAADNFAVDDIGRSAIAWSTATDDAKERALKRATREVDAYLRSSGIAHYNPAQSLLYPRAVDTRSNAAYIPSPIQRATWAQAKFLNANANVLDDAQTRKARGLNSASEPNISYNESPLGTSEPHLCDEALGYLYGVFARAATVRSVVVGTPYTYPVIGDPGLDVLP